MFITVGNELGFDIETFTIAILPSTIITSSIVNVGTPSSSMIVPIALSVTLLVLPEVTVPFSKNVSSGSSVKSTVVGTFTVVVNCPAGIVIVVFIDVKSVFDAGFVPVVSNAVTT